MLDMSNSRELASIIIDEALPGMLEAIVHDFHVPDKYSNSDRLKAVELFMKAKGMLQQDKQPQLLSVDINFISADIPAKADNAQTLTIDMPEVPPSPPLQVEDQSDMATVLPQTPEQALVQAVKADDPFANLEALLEDI